MMEVVEILCSSDGKAKKYRLKTDDEYIIECLYVDYSNKNIICFSTQIGCPVQCNICSAGEFIRSLTASELVAQCFIVVQDIKNEKDILFSAMGVGEPVMNEEALIEFFEYVNSKDSRFRFSLSTIIPKLNKFIEMCDKLYVRNIFPKIQISLHSCNPFERYEIFGGNSSLIENIRLAILYAKLHFNLELNYTLIHGVNDSNEDIEELIEFNHDLRIPIKINQFNQINKTFFPSLSARVKKIILKLEEAGFIVEYYKTNGYDIKGACGQLVGGDYTRLLKPVSIDYVSNLKSCMNYVLGRKKNG